MDNFVCVHGHFYQPPRENPWLETVEVQDSAYPYHDWNERITAECYAPNAWARVLDPDDKVVRMVSNYSRMSFNFGPSLLSWMQENSPKAYRAVLQADADGSKRFGGHGPAIAQCYSHMIMPLANSRDMRTQVAWGLADFRSRFKREPEGMWLPETAVDLGTLSALAEQGIKFTLLAPRQAKRVRRLPDGPWEDATDERVDPTRPYITRLPGGKSIVVFFYDGPISKAVAFEGLLRSGPAFASRLLGGLNGDRARPQLMHIATDGETYGHHHRFGEMALARALDDIESGGSARLTVYGQYLAAHPPEYEAEVVDNTAWSCAHGVERWRSDCGCNTGGRPGWDQRWRAPLREALDWLRDALSARYEAEASKLLRDPWAARDSYISVVLDRSPASVSAFFAEQSRRKPGPEQTVRALKLLELQRHAMLMYTSCGWFFDDISGIESTQVLQYAGRAVHLAQDLFGDSLEERFVHRLSAARSNVAAQADGGAIYRRWVKPVTAGLLDVGAHYAISSLFKAQGEKAQLPGYDVETLETKRHTLGKASLLLGRSRVKSRATLDEVTLRYGVLHEGDHNLTAGVRIAAAPEPHGAAEDATAAFASADFPGVGKVFDRMFEEHRYSLRSLFRDEQRKVLGKVLSDAQDAARAVYSSIYEREAPIIRFLVAAGSPVPQPFKMAADLFFDWRLRRALEAHGALNQVLIKATVAEAEAVGASLDRPGLGHQFDRLLHRLAEDLGREPDSLDRLRRLSEAVELAMDGPFQMDLWEQQSLYHEMLSTHLPAAANAAQAGDPARVEWVERFKALGEKLGVRADR